MRRLLILASAIVFVDTMFYAAIAPLLPHLQSEFELSKAGAGVLTGSYAAGTLLASLPGGWLAVRIGVRPTVMIGLGLMSASSVAFALAHDIVILDIARFVEGVGGALSWAAALAWLINAGPADRRGELIGTALGAAIVGALFGPVLGGAADSVGRGPVFAVVALSGLGLMYWAASTPAPAATERASFAEFGGALRDSRIRMGGWLVLLLGLIGGTIGVLVPLRMDDLGATAVAIAAAFLLSALLEAMVAPLSGRASDRRGRLGPSRVGLIAGFVATIALMLPGAAWVMFAVVVLAEPAIGILWSPAMAMLSDGAEGIGLNQALAAGLTNLTWGLGQMAGSVAGAEAGESFGDTSAYATLAVLCLLTLGLLARRSALVRTLEASA
jgi:MFS family permease